ncbi:MAG: tetratricopeptide repeat protein [Patiriisocius sp.]|uniref:tetratricopeptide repeat protein n=1 Tax=Patiriisocius sp. TaxID=2822396 RepID=UPI003EF52619
MATYKKRGGKPKNTRVENSDIEALEQDSTTAEVFNTLDEGANRTEKWVEKNQNIILTVVGVVAVAVLAYLAYVNFVQKPKEAEGMNEMYQAQTYFDTALNATNGQDSIYNLALNGGKGKYGFLKIIDNYGGTKAGNLANYYAGTAYMNMNDYKNAIKYLSDFESDDAMLGPLAKGAIGDAFAQLDQKDEALGYYETAATMQENEFTSPRFLLKAGITAMALGKADVAKKHLNNIVENYATSAEAAKAKVYLAQAEAMN